MYPRISAAKKAAMRQLRELLPPTYARLAAIGGVHSVTVREIASRENWSKLDVTRNTVMRALSPKQLVVYEAMLLADSQVGNGDADGVVELELADLPPGDIGALMVAEMRGILAGLQAGRFDKARADALLVTIRMAERLGQLDAGTARPEIDQEKQTRSDVELAEILERVDQRIVELARGYAERLVAAQSDAASG